MNNKAKRIIGILLCCITVIFGMFYYYYIHAAFVPNGEDLSQVWLRYTERISGYKWNPGNIVFSIVLALTYKIGGLSYETIQLEFAIFCTIIMILTLILSINTKDSNKNYGALPVFILFMILLQPIKEGSSFGKIWGDDVDMIYLFPFDYHAMSLIFALLCLCILLFIGRCWSSKNVRVAGIIAFIAIFAYGLKHTDLIYYVVFVAPFVCVLVMHAIRNEKFQKYVLLAGLLLFAAICITKFLPGDLPNKIWETERTSVYGDIYGATNFMEISEWGVKNIINYVITVFDLFNISLWERPIISMWSLVFVLKAAVLLAGYVMLFRIIRSSIQGRIKEDGYEIVDEIVAWGFVILSLVYILTDIGSNISNTRYMTMLVPYMTILICRHVYTRIIDALHIAEDNSKGKLMVSLTIALLCVSYAEPVWNYKASDYILSDCEMAVDFVEKNRESSSEIAVAPHWLFARLTCMSDGEIIFYPDIETAKRYEGENVSIRFMVTSTDNSDTTHRLNNCAQVGSYDDLCDKYGEPVKSIALEHFEVYVF